MLKIDTTTIDGEDFTIRQASVFRVLRFQKEVAKADGDQDKLMPLILDLLQRCVLKSEEDPSPRYNREEDFDDIAFPTLLDLQNKIVEFSSAKSMDELVEDAEKNSETTVTSN